VDRLLEAILVAVPVIIGSILGSRRPARLRRELHDTLKLYAEAKAHAELEVAAELGRVAVTLTRHLRAVTEGPLRLTRPHWRGLGFVTGGVLCLVGIFVVELYTLSGRWWDVVLISVTGVLAALLALMVSVAGGLLLRGPTHTIYGPVQLAGSLFGDEPGPGSEPTTEAKATATHQ
jgi:hypothetical protein